MEPQKKDIKVFQTMLLHWFEISGRQFPWRSSGLSAFQLVVSEVLLQRTKANTVDKIYNNFFQVYSDWKAIAGAGVEELENALKPIGLYKQRALRLQNLARFMVLNNGLLPLARPEIEAIPMMGQYIANAVELLVHGKNKPLLDVNMVRVLERYFGPRVLKDIRYDPYLQALAHDVVDHPKSKQINWAILDFAALICQARAPKCGICILQQTCKYYSTQNDMEILFERD